MVCKDCKNQYHDKCENTRHLNSYGSVYGLYGTWCDCQHRARHRLWVEYPSIQDQVKHGLAVNIVSLP